MSWTYSSMPKSCIIHYFITVLEHLSYTFRTNVLKDKRLSLRKEKILETSIKLFNEKGCMNTSTRHISDKLGISVGNLYYYFKNKEEIIIAIYEEFMLLLSRQILIVDEKLDEPFDFYNFIENQIEYELKYRFIRLEVANIYTTYPKVKDTLQQGNEKKVQEMKKLYKHQIRYGYFIDIDKSEMEYLCSNTWIINSQWEIYWVIRKVENEKLRRLQGVLNFLYFIKRYATQKGLEQSTLLKSIEYVNEEIKNVSS